MASPAQFRFGSALRCLPSILFGERHNGGHGQGVCGLDPLYDRLLVPLIFEPYARDLAERVAKANPSAVLEIAAGTGVVTRALAADCRRRRGDRRHRPQPGHARPCPGAPPDGATGSRGSRPMPCSCRLPTRAFDAVVCQFGVMFFPDKAEGFAEARRVLRPGGRFLFNAWDRSRTTSSPTSSPQALATVFPDDPPRFMARTPHGYHDAAIAADLAAARLREPPAIDDRDGRSRAPRRRDPGVAYCQGTPLRNEIEAGTPHAWTRRRRRPPRRSRVASAAGRSRAASVLTFSLPLAPRAPEVSSRNFAQRNLRGPGAAGRT